MADNGYMRHAEPELEIEPEHMISYGPDGKVYCPADCALKGKPHSHNPDNIRIAWEHDAGHTAKKLFMGDGCLDCP